MSFVRVTAGANGMQFRFSGGGDFEAFHDCELWLRANGFSVGSMQRGAPIGVMHGDYEISKWRNLSADDRAALHATISAGIGSFRNGPIDVTLNPGAPKSAFAAFANRPTPVVAATDNEGGER